MPDRTELDDNNPLRPSGCLSLLPGWRCHRARAFLLLHALVLENAVGYVSNSAESGKDQLSPRPQGRAPCNPRTMVEYRPAAISDSSLRIIDPDAEPSASLLCSVLLYRGLCRTTTNRTHNARCVCRSVLHKDVIICAWGFELLFLCQDHPRAVRPQLLVYPTAPTQ